jgi:hypothetical protein
MDINKYIKDNLDDILDNTDEYISKNTQNKNTEKKIKKVSWKEDIEEKSKITDTQNEDDDINEEKIEELFEKMYNLKTEKEYYETIGKNEKKPEHIQMNEEEISEHKIKLLNLFLIHYNEKYEKKTHYFSDIKNIEKDTNNQMELFFETIIEFKKIKEELCFEEDEECMDYYFEETDDENITEMFNKFTENQMYCLDYNNKRIISPSILICLNYLINNKRDLFEKKNWNIFNLRDY